VLAAPEEEHRRVRRDLHDGLGPTLTGIAYSADAAANLLRSDADKAALLLRGLRSDAADAIAEIRRIVYGLRPNALDELGLVGAVRQQVSRLRAADGRPLQVDVQPGGTRPHTSSISNSNPVTFTSRVPFRTGICDFDNHDFLVRQGHFRVTTRSKHQLRLQNLGSERVNLRVFVEFQSCLAEVLVREDFWAANALKGTTLRSDGCVVTGVHVVVVGFRFGGIWAPN
jgi:hypothetical protein